MIDEKECEIYNQVLRGELKRDIVVLEDMQIMPCINEDYHSQYFYIGMCRSGRTIGQYDYRDTDFRAGDICWIMPGHVLSHKYISDDYNVLSVFITIPYFQWLKKQGVVGKYKYLSHVSCLSLNKEQFDIMYNGFKLLGMLAESSSAKRDELVASLIGIIASIGDEYVIKHLQNTSTENKLRGELFEYFYDAVIEHYRESREVSFYARLLCLTPKYFATVIKQTTGVAATEWINRYVVIEAKWLLLHERTKSIQQIASYLGFSEQASFSRLFKRYEGVTPTEFREVNN